MAARMALLAAAVVLEAIAGTKEIQKFCEPRTMRAQVAEPVARLGPEFLMLISRRFSAFGTRHAAQSTGQMMPSPANSAVPVRCRNLPKCLDFRAKPNEAGWHKACDIVFRQHSIRIVCP
jgi:hypothetical protein